MFDFWNDDDNRSRRLVRGGLDIRSRNLNKNLHLARIDAKTSIDVNFYHKEQDKCQVVDQ